MCGEWHHQLEVSRPGRIISDEDLGKPSFSESLNARGWVSANDDSEISQVLRQPGMEPKIFEPEIAQMLTCFETLCNFIRRSVGI